MARKASRNEKTSLVIDREQVAEAKEVLGTTMLTETIDRALDELLNLAARRLLIGRIRHSKSGGIGPAPAPEELRRLREP